MPSVPNKKGFYKRKDGAYIKIKGRYKRVGPNKHKTQQYYSKRNISSDLQRKARTININTKKGMSYAKRYPQAYDQKGKKL